MRAVIRIIQPDQFVAPRHFFAGALNALPDQRLEAFLDSSSTQLQEAYCQLFPETDRSQLARVLAYRPRFLPWAGSDLFLVRNKTGNRDVVLLETNSSPSGQKYMPGRKMQPGQTGYDLLADQVLAPAIDNGPDGIFAVLYDKNGIEASGYAAAMANRLQEPVHLVALHLPDAERFMRHGQTGLEILTGSGWRVVRGGWRYVTDRPWRRLALRSQSPLVNHIIACLAGGRNKAAAAFAYDAFNKEHQRHGLNIRVPQSLINVARHEVPDRVARLGGRAMVKIPYSNAGQGVFPITNPQELADFMGRELPYERLIVQDLIGVAGWSNGLEQVGTLPDAQGHSYSADLRLMVGATPLGFRPVAAYGRRARLPLPTKITDGCSSADFLLTNLSYRENGSWKSDKRRVLVLNSDNMDRFGWQLADLANGFIQTCFAMIAIDQLACRLMALPDRDLIGALRDISDDPPLLSEVADFNRI